MVDERFPSNTAVLLLAYGGPDSLEDIPVYLLDIRGGRETPQPLIDEITERYRLIGGRSPLLDITRSVANKLRQRIALPVYTGMRHWQPTISDVVEQMDHDGVRHIVAICMAPHFSQLSIGKYRQNLDQAVAGRDMPVTFIESWHTQPDYLRGLAGNVTKTLARWPESKRDDVLIIFTAHSLPQSILEMGDPYDRQLRETALFLAEELSLPESGWFFSYQSAARTPVPWLGPQVEDLVIDLAADGYRDLLIAPIGFIADHVEILYDIDIGVENIASSRGLRLERTPMLNDSPPLIDALVSLSQEALEVAI
jgi:ferrochelatase